VIAALLVIAAVAAPGDELAHLEAAAETLEPQRALFALASAPDPSPAVRAMRAQLDALERDLRAHVAEIDANDALLTDPDLRQRRSDIAVTALRLRLPILRARLTALDPSADGDDLATAIASMNALAYAWGDAASRRRVALGSLLLRTNRPGDALGFFESASAADPLTPLARTACRAAADTLGIAPLDPALLQAALCGAALGPGRLTAASEIGAGALRTAPEWRLKRVRETVYATLEELARAHGARPPLVRVALAETPDDLRRFIDSAGSRNDPLALMEAQWRRWTLAGDADALFETALGHPNRAAQHDAASRCTAYLLESPRAPRLRARELSERLPDHPHRGQWLLMYAEVAPVDDALAALDGLNDPSVAVAARLLAARRAREAFDDSRDTRSAERLITRAAAARGAAHDPSWTAWLVSAECDARLVARGPIDAGGWLLAQPHEHATGAARALAPDVLAAALEAEALGNGRGQNATAQMAAQTAELAGNRVTRSRALTLAGEPDAALDALRGAPATPERDLARAEALYSLGRDDEAFPLYRTIAESFEAHRRDSDAYWRSWTRLLEIVARQNGASRSEEIVREINRLRIQDRRLGGDPHRRRLESLESEMRSVRTP